MQDAAKFLLGAGASALAGIIWNHTPLKDSFKASLEDPDSPVGFFEHYHVGLSSCIIATYTKGYSQILNGFGAGLIVQEAVGDHPFAIGKDPRIFVPATILGLVLAGMLVYRYM